MAYVVWKMIRGCGPYAYLCESVWSDGRSRMRHLGYLGRWGGEGDDRVEPGMVVRGPDFSPSVRRLLGGRLAAAAGDLGGRADRAEATGAEADLGGRTEDGLATTVEGQAATPVADAGSDVGSDVGSEKSAPVTVRPHRLPGGAWGVLSTAPLAVGDLVQVRTASGSTWTATVSELLEPTPRGFVARTSGRPRGRL